MLLIGSVKNATDKEQYTLKSRLDSWCVEHADFSVALPQKEPWTVLGFPHPFSLKDRRNGRQTHYTLTIERPFKCTEMLPVDFTCIKSCGSLRFIAGVGFR